MNGFGNLLALLVAVQRWADAYAADADDFGDGLMDHFIANENLLDVWRTVTAPLSPFTYDEKAE